MVVDIDFNNLEQYKVAFVPFNINIDKYDDIELFFYKGMIRTSGKDNYINVGINENNKTFVIMRLIIYALFDWYELTKSNEVMLKDFLDWLRADYKYTNYLILVYLHHKLMLKENVNDKWKTLLDSDDYNKINFDKMKQTSISRFSVDFVLDEKDFKRSKFNPSKFRMKTRNIDLVLVMMQGFLFSFCDIDIKTNQKISTIKFITTKTRVKKMMVLNRNFFKLKENFEVNKWLL